MCVLSTLYIYLYKEIGLILVDLEYRFIALRRGVDRIALRFKIATQEQQQPLLVFHEQDTGITRRSWNCH